MRSWFVRTVDAPAGFSTPSDSYFSKLSQSYEESGIRYRAPLSVALLSVTFQECPLWFASPAKGFLYGEPILGLLTVGLFLTSLLVASAQTSRLAIAIFIAIVVIAILPDWLLLANHTYLALWTIPVAVLFREWWTSELYAFYLRTTIGIVMLAAFSAKILAGTYVDGSYIAYLSANGALTERTFSLLCNSSSPDPCIYYQAVSIFILAWQFAVGILLLLGLNSLIFLAVEIGFLLGAGVYADEMNFQILNISLLCIVFRFGMPLWLMAVSVTLLLVDLFGISNLIQIVLHYVA